MPQFCDVALPVPVESVFTYRISRSGVPKVGSRVLVPFRSAREVGVVVRLHDSQPSVECKEVLKVLDPAAVLSPELLRLAEWISQYYLAPIGEAVRAMLPPATGVKRARVLRITDAGLEALHESATRGSSLRAKKSAAEQDTELRVLDKLAGGELSEAAILRLEAGRAAVESLVRKKWIAREDVSDVRNAERGDKIIVLATDEDHGKQTPQQSALLERLQQSGGRMPLAELRRQKVSESALATLIRRDTVKIERELRAFHYSSIPAAPPIELTAAQSAVFERVRQAATAKKFHVALLHGVTGSGKTAVYLAAMRDVLAAGRSALLLVPEIGLTPAAVANLYSQFGSSVALLHSALTTDERAEQWRRIASGEARIVVGTRSAIFAPARDLALIVVDEEQDTSYKQEETPRYHGRDVAVMRGKLANAMVLLCSATPSLESYHNAQHGKYELLELRERVEKRPLPQTEIIDMRQEFQETGEQHLFSRRLSQEIRERLERGEQAMILLNRRGYSPAVLCRACGESMQCKNCSIALTHHKGAQTLECHYCGYRRAVSQTCPSCSSDQLFFLGAGSERLEERLNAEFPRARIGRLDRDTVRERQDFERVLAALIAGEIDLLVGTQMIAKGHDVHGVTLVGVVGADFALGFPDFRAAERTFQLLTQVAGRAGRGQIPGRVVLQTYSPDHYAIQFAAQHDYAGFCEKELRYRRWMNYPPFTALANVLVRSPKLEQALRFSGALGDWLKKHGGKEVRILGPAAAPFVRLKNDYRYHFILKSESRERLNGVLRGLLSFAREQKIPRTQMVVDVDPVSLM